MLRILDWAREHQTGTSRVRVRLIKLLVGSRSTVVMRSTAVGGGMTWTLLYSR
jgi:hypothetical protein